MLDQTGDFHQNRQYSGQTNNVISVSKDDQSQSVSQWSKAIICINYVLKRDYHWLLKANNSLIPLECSSKSMVRHDKKDVKNTKNRLANSILVY